MKKKSTPKLKKVEGFYIPNRKKKVSYKDKAGNKKFRYEERYKSDDTFLRQAWRYNQHLFDNYAEFKRSVGDKLITASKTTTTGRYNLRVPKGQLSKEEYLEQVFALNKSKIMNAYSSFANKRSINEETAFRRFKEEYNLREMYILGRTGRSVANRSEILNALQRSDFFNTTEQRQRYSLLEQMKLEKTGKRRTMLKDFMRDTGYYSVDQMINNQDIRNYYSLEKIPIDDKKHYWKTTYLFRGMDNSIWEVVIENSPTKISYRRAGEEEFREWLEANMKVLY